MKSLSYDLTHKEFPLVLKPGSSAAVGIGSRRGAGKVRHIDTSSLWLQQHVTAKNTILEKTPGETNPADFGTTRLAGPRMLQLMRLLGLEKKQGRHRLALSVGKMESSALLPVPADV